MKAASIPLAGLTAHQGLRRGGGEVGTSVLIDGASGGVGTFAVRIADAIGYVEEGHTRGKVVVTA